MKNNDDNTNQGCTEQLGEGPGNGGIAESEPNGHAEQLNKGPGNGGMIKSASEKKGTKRKLELKTIETKFNAIIEVEKGQKSKAEVARMFGVPKNTLSGWLKKTDSIKEGYLKFGPKRRNMRQGQYNEIDEAVLRWFKEARDRDIPISGPQLLLKASFFADRLGVSEFKESVGWLDNFKARYDISFKQISGEAKSVDTESEAMGAWASRLKTILNTYSQKDIYNADETGLFYKLTPEKTLEFKSVNCSGGKRSKDRLTVLVCTNMSGDDKVPLFVIGKAEKPRCFKNVKTLPTEYANNKKAWMTGDLFKSWLQKLDKRFIREHRKVAMIIDNCPAHPVSVKLQAIDLIFLPPNTTCHTQPCDQGIIKNLKVKYRKLVISKQLAAMDKHETFSVSVLDAMRMLKIAWQMVTQSTIANCFKHAGFIGDAESTLSYDSDDDVDDNIPISRLVEMERMDVESFVNVDLTIPVCSESTDTDIVLDLISSRNNTETGNNDSDDEDDDETETPQPTKSTLADAFTGYEFMRDFFETQSGSDRELIMLSSLYKSLVKKDFASRAAKQSLIKDHFQ